LVLTPAQYQSTTPESNDGTLRQFNSLDFRLYYLKSNWTSDSQVKTAAVAAAPNIFQVAAHATSDGKVEFALHVFGDASAGIQGLWVAYTDPTAASPRWQSIDLVQRSATDPTLWETPAGGVTLAGNLTKIVFMAQAVNGTGLVSLATNNGAFYTVAPYTPPAPPSTRPKTLAFQYPHAAGAYRRDTSIIASPAHVDQTKSTNE